MEFCVFHKRAKRASVQITFSTKWVEKKGKSVPQKVRVRCGCCHCVVVVIVVLPMDFSPPLTVLIRDPQNTVSWALRHLQTMRIAWPLPEFWDTYAV